MTSFKPKILIIDDTPAIVRALSRILGKYYDILGLTDPKEAKEAISKEKFSAIVSDVMMPGLSGPELLLETTPENASRFIFYSGGSSGLARDLLDSLPNKVLDKGCSTRTLLEAVHEVVRDNLANS